MCYKQKCKVVSLNLAHPVYVFGLFANRYVCFKELCCKFQPITGKACQILIIR